MWIYKVDCLNLWYYERWLYLSIHDWNHLNEVSISPFFKVARTTFSFLRFTPSFVSFACCFRKCIVQTRLCMYLHSLYGLSSKGIWSVKDNRNRWHVQPPKTGPLVKIISKKISGKQSDFVYYLQLFQIWSHESLY